MFKSLISGICCVLTIPPQLTVGSTLNGSRNRPLARIFLNEDKRALEKKNALFSCAPDNRRKKLNLYYNLYTFNAFFSLSNKKIRVYSFLSFLYHV